MLIGSSLSKQERQGIRLLLQSSQAPSLSILGIGSREGTPVAQESGEFLKDEQGAILVPRLDSPTLKAFASEMGGRYRAARLDDKDLRQLGVLDAPQAMRDDGQRLRLDTWADQGYWLLLPLLMLAACAGRRGGCSACLCCCWARPSRATRSSCRICGCAPTSKASTC